MGPLQRTPGTASTAISQDHPWLRCCERISLVKNRRREICTSGSVRGGGGNVPTYSARGLSQRLQARSERGRLGKRREIAEEVQRALGERGLQARQEHPAVEPGEHANRQEEPRSA